MAKKPISMEVYRALSFTLAGLHSEAWDFQEHWDETSQKIKRYRSPRQRRLEKDVNACWKALAALRRPKDEE